MVGQLLLNYDEKYLDSSRDRSEIEVSLLEKILPVRPKNQCYPDREIVILDKCCGLPWCPRCGPGYWARVWRKVERHLGMFKKPRLFTLTVDPKKFSSGQAAYEYIERDGQYIKRFMRVMGFKKGFKVLAFHKPKESRPDAHNWPHWHIVVDLADCGGFADLKRGWRLWRDKWGLGGFDLGGKNRRVRTALQAVKYCVSYCQRQSGIVADWVMDSERAPRGYELYGDLRLAVRGCPPSSFVDSGASEECRGSHDIEGSLKRKNTVVSYVGCRINKCSSGSVVMLRTSYGLEDRYEYIGELPYSPGQVAFASKMGYVPSVRRSVHVSPDEMTESLRVSIPLARYDDVGVEFEYFKSLMAQVDGLEVIPF